MSRPVVYFAQADGLIKIGTSTKLAKRLREVEAGCNGPLALLAWTEGDKTTERAYHQRFAHLRELGEWFRPAPELHEAIEALGRPGLPVQEAEAQISIRPEQVLYDRLAAEAKDMRRSINQHVLAILWKHFADEPK